MEQNCENLEMLDLCVWLQEHINLCKSLSICNDKNLGESFIKIISNNVEYGKSLLNKYFINKRGLKKISIPVSGSNRFDDNNFYKSTDVKNSLKLCVLDNYEKYSGIEKKDLIPSKSYVKNKIKNQNFK